MATKVLAPKLGEGVNELTIVRWLKQEGETVKEFESLLEVETDKVVTEIPSPATGTLLKHLVTENAVAGVGSVIAWIGQPGESIPVEGASNTQIVTRVEKENQAETVSAGNGSVSSVKKVSEGSNRNFISPVVAKIAGEHQVDLTRVMGTGLGGRITKKDILDFVETAKVPGEGKNPPSAASGDKLVPVNVVRRSIAERMLISKQISPQVLTVMEADMSRVSAHMASNKDVFARDGLKLTYTAYFIAAIVSGLRAFPLANSSWSEAGLVIHGSYNIGMATSLGEEGLIVPVIKDADRLSLAGITRAVNDLSTRARAKKLQPEEVKNGTFTLTNHGVSGSLFAMPIINQPQCGILGTGSIQKRAVVITDSNGQDAIAIRPMVYLSFVFDHRILDGALADMFLGRVVESLENWHD